MLPKAQHTPTICFEPHCVLRITLAVAPKLLLPEVPIVLRICRVAWTAVPETTVDENCQSWPNENQVGACGTNPIM